MQKGVQRGLFVASDPAGNQAGASVRMAGGRLCVGLTQAHPVLQQRSGHRRPAQAARGGATISKPQLPGGISGRHGEPRAACGRGARTCSLRGSSTGLGYGLSPWLWVASPRTVPNTSALWDAAPPGPVLHKSWPRVSSWPS